jgi:uncharacterized membrane protein
MSQHIEAPIEQVFELLIDAKRWPEWMSGGMEIKEITGPLDVVGTRVREESAFLGRKMESWNEVVEVERPRLLRLAGESAGMKYTGSFRLTPAGTGTEAEVESEYELPAGFLGHIADRLFMERAMERQSRHSAENFKALVEAKVAVPA